MIEVPKEILWDYQKAPEDIGWRLQRIADFFPLYGKDPATIALLYEHRDQLKLDDATLALIEAYHALLHSFSGSDLRFPFYLTGGTALSAFHLFHRLPGPGCAWA